MKYNNKLNLGQYIQVVKDMANEFFDIETGEYTPHIGELYAACLYFNLCVELEETDEFKTQPITDISDIEQLLNNKEFCDQFYKETTFDDSYISFGNAYMHALSIVEYRKRDANSFAEAVSKGLEAVLKAFRESFSDSEIEKIIKLANDIKSGTISNESIAEAYSNTVRYKEVSEDKSDDATERIINFINK